MAKIVSIKITEYDRLVIRLDNGQEFTFWDGGRECCEVRYMSSNDNPDDYIAAEYRGYELVECSSSGCYYVHEIQFLNINTSVGVFQVVNHNEHNGYYGGFDIKVSKRNVSLN